MREIAAGEQQNRRTERRIPNASKSNMISAGTASAARKITIGLNLKPGTGVARPSLKPRARRPFAISETSATLVFSIDIPSCSCKNGRKYTTRTLRSRTPSR
jgi:hypothetical protein